MQQQHQKRKQERKTDGLSRSSGAMRVVVLIKVGGGAEKRPASKIDDLLDSSMQCSSLEERG
jgi:hypothetical protein